MKTTLMLIGTIVFLVVSSCDEQVQVITNGAQLPVVYSLFNPTDSLISVRLTKTFAGAESAEVMAQDPNNLYYANAEVSMDINSKEGYPITSYKFEKTQLPDKAEGLFTSGPNYCYCLKGPLNLLFSEGFQIRLLVRIPESNQLISAQQNYYAPPVIQLPRTSNQTRFSLYSPEAQRIKWIDKFGFQRYSLIIRLKYINRFQELEETRNFDVSFRKESGIFKPDQEPISILHFFDGDDFLRRIGGGIPVDPGIISRSFVSIDLIVVGLSREYCDYEDTNQIAPDRQGLPVSNIIGGIGLFALRVSKEQGGYLLDPVSLDSLVHGRHTKQLKFVKW